MAVCVSHFHYFDCDSLYLDLNLGDLPLLVMVEDIGLVVVGVDGIDVDVVENDVVVVDGHKYGWFDNLMQFVVVIVELMQVDYQLLHLYDVVLVDIQ